MRFPLLTVLIAVALAAALPAGAEASSGTLLRVRSCQTGDTAKQRSAVFYGRMRAVPGTSRMWMRFRLVDRSSNSAPLVPVPHLSHWRKSRPGVTSFGYAQRITGLRRGGTYAAAVDFRWLDARGRTIKTVRRTSSDCRQDGDLPNLTVSRITAQRGDASGTELYLVDVTNTGAANAEGIRLDLVVDGSAADSADIDLIEPGETVTKKISGPACSARVRAVVDRLDAIPETNEDDNTRRSRCPAVGA